MASYLERISLSKDAKAEAVNKRVAGEAAAQINVDIFSTTRSISDAEGKLEDAKNQTPFNAGNVIALQRTVSALKEDLSALTDLKSELFPG